MITIDSLKGIIGSRDPAELIKIAKGLGIDVSSFLGSDFDINKAMSQLIVEIVLFSQEKIRNIKLA